MKDSLSAIILPHIIAGFVVFGLMILAAFWGLAYAWWHLRARLVKEPLPLWRRNLATIGLIAVSVQALLFILYWIRIGPSDALLGQWARWVDITFLVAAPCVLAEKGAARWCLLSSSILLFIVCFLISLSP
jgi:hypothetical protein